MNKLIEALINKSEKTLNSLEGKHIQELTKILDAAFNRLEANFLKVFESGEAVNQLQKTLMLKGMLQELNAYLNLLTSQEITDYTQRLDSLLTQAANIGLELGEDMVKAIDAETPLINAGVNLEAVALAVKNSGDRLRNHTEDFKQRAIAIIGFNLSIGSSARKTASALQESLSLTKKRAVDIARTETIAALNDGANSFYEANDIDYVQLFATADDRLCKYCAARNQSIYKRGEISSPLHIRCRCYLVGIYAEWLENKSGVLDQEFSKNFFEEGKKEVANLDNGLAPFEKSNGLTSPPKPVRKP